MSFRSIKDVFTAQEEEVINERIYRRVCLSGFRGTEMEEFLALKFYVEEYERAYKEFNK